MANSNGNGGLFNRQSIVTWAGILLVGGGGGVMGVNSANEAERRVDKVEVGQAVIIEKVKNIEDDLERIEEDSKERHEVLLDAIKKLEK